MITNIPKQGKLTTEMSSNRPISLLNTNVKILAALFATQLNRILSKLVHGDQVGFVPGWQAVDTIPQVLQVMHVAHEDPQPMFLVGVDAEKAFDRVSWEFLCGGGVLDKLGFGPHFQLWLRNLYWEPRVSVRVNGGCSQNFFLRRGTRQGCPCPRYCSPLLWNL